MIIIVMGVSSSGKSVMGKLLADRLGWPFYDGDDFHPKANIEKMNSGIPLIDEDRSAWLRLLADLIRHNLESDLPAVIACSALKQKYRDQLHVDSSDVRFVYLQGNYELIQQRMEARKGHFMKADMLASQFEALEEPDDALTVSIERTPEEIVTQILHAWFKER